MAGVNLKLSDESHDGWSRFTREHGVSLAVLLEVLGRHINDDVFRVAARDRIISEARDLTHERRRAGGPRRRG